MFNLILKSTIPEKRGVEKRVEQKEIEAGCEVKEESPQSHSEAKASVVPSSGEHHSLALDRPRRANYGVPSTRYGYEDMVAYASQVEEEVDPHEPSTYREAVIGTESIQWLAVMGKEMESLQKNQT
ncbi:hypothetical protein LIER_21707 [Lithospermum erythrorhizon]|uniref:Uncharacterized protein n=1 Tax=Lithospermum erythrorhizon TaxID=34254 RepID=A0AAV3QRB9_LITER